VTKALLIRNPTSRRALPPERVRALFEVARDAGWMLDDAPTERAGHAIDIARAAAESGVDVVIVHGGDGTLNEAVNGVAAVAGARTAIAPLRGGTANVWAKEAGFAKDPVASMRQIIGGAPRPVDLGVADGAADRRRFLLMAGIGLDARIVPAIGARMKRRLGALAYVIAGVSAAVRTKPWQADVSVDGERRETPLYWALVSNTRNYGGIVHIARRACVDDGVLDFALMRRGGLHLLPDGIRAFAGRVDRSPNIISARPREVVVHTPGIPVQLDGEAHGETPMRFTVEPAAVRMIVPSGARLPLWSR
jgi:YegS/Rv2252/BmrU family lipid kinase